MAVTGGYNSDPTAVASDSDSDSDSDDSCQPNFSDSDTSNDTPSDVSAPLPSPRPLKPTLDLLLPCSPLGGTDLGGIHSESGGETAPWCSSPTTSVGSSFSYLDGDTLIEGVDPHFTEKCGYEENDTESNPLLYSKSKDNLHNFPLASTPCPPHDTYLEDSEEEREMRRYATWASYFGFTRRGHAVCLVFGIASALVSAVVLPISSILLGHVFAEFALYGRGEVTAPDLLPRVSEWIKYYVFLAGGGWLAYGAFYCSWMWFGELQAESARAEIYQALMAKELEWFDNTEHEILRVANRCHTQITEFQLAASQPLGLLLQAVVSAVACLIIAFYFSWHLTLICLAGMPVAALTVAFFSNGMEHGIGQQSLALGSAAQSISRAVKGIDTVKYFNGQEMEISLYGTAVKAAGLAYNRIAKYAAFQNAILRFLTLMVFVQGFWYATTLVTRTTTFQEYSGYMTAFWACLIAGQQIETIFPLVIVLEKGKYAASNLRRLTMVDVEFDLTRRRAGVSPRKCNGFIAFQDVRFHYPSRRDVAGLNGLSMFVNAGETVFIVGKSGCGKSTLANLLLTVWKHNSGSILIDENPLEKLDRKWIHDNVTYVPQRPALFNESISRNIRFGKANTDDLTHKDIWRVCDDVFLTEVITGLPNGLRTKLRSGGTNLSGGQRQRVSLARARLRDTPIMILDEPTTGLDEATKVLVMNTLREWRKDKTTIVITHNLSDIRPNDWVYVMDAGRVVQVGERRTLEALYQGPFADLLKNVETPYEESIPPESCYEESLIDCYMNDPEKENQCPNRTTILPFVENSINAFRQSLAPRAHKSFNPSRVTFQNHRATTAAPPVPSRSQTIKRATSQSRKRPRRTRQSMEEIPPKPECKSTMMKGQQGLRHIFSTIGPHTDWSDKVGIAIGILSCIVSAAATPAFSFALARLVYIFFTDLSGTGTKAAFWALVITGIALIDAATSSLQLFLLEKSAQRWIDSVRIRAYGLVMSQARSWFDVDKNKISRIAQDLEGNAEEMRNLLGRQLGFAVGALTILGIGVGWSFTQDVQLTAVGLVAIPVLLLVLRVFSWVTERCEERCNGESEQLAIFLRDMLDNIVAVRTLSLKGYFDHKHHRLLRRSLSAGRKRAVCTGLTVGLSDTGVFLATALLFWYGARLIVQNGLALEKALTVFSMLLFSLSNSAATLRIVPQVSASKDYARRVLRLLELKSISHENQGSRKIDLDGSLIIRDVSFSYPSRRRATVLRGINLQINPGEFIAIVGSSGSGKSTLVSLMERLYSPSSGEVIFSGYQSSDLDIGHLRRQIAIVPQNPYLFPASVRENILYGSNEHYKLSGSMHGERGPQIQQIINAANAAGLGEWINGLKHGYDTLLNMGDESLSGGQLQKIAIARALVRDPRILILDQATAGLDAASSSTVLDSVWSLKNKGVSGGWRGWGTTVIMVTHKTDMMRMADRVVVLEEGRVVDEGNFTDLITRSESFRRLLKKQEEEDNFV
ncbi:hypothetical protein TWF132_011886 [Orbilia oligospora]|nr:hypothetical protein TWF128_004923 [Orbilia oligospora]KAF3280035.1 hypothetical protein TWF132_011886 [Orbilia oligospora]